MTQWVPMWNTYVVDSSRTQTPLVGFHRCVGVVGSSRKKKIYTPSILVYTNLFDWAQSLERKKLLILMVLTMTFCSYMTLETCDPKHAIKNFVAIKTSKKA